MRHKSIVTEARQIDRAITLIQQALVRQVGFGFQHLKPRAELDEDDGAVDLPGFGDDALVAHGEYAE